MSQTRPTSRSASKRWVLTAAASGGAVLTSSYNSPEQADGWFIFRVIVLMAIAKHLVDAWLLLAAPRSIHSLGTGTILSVAFGQSLLAGLALLATSLLALLALRRNNTAWIRRLLLAPQQFWLTVAAVGALMAIVGGQYPDGYVPAGGSLFILGDQIPRLLFATLHGIIMVRAS